MNKIAFILLMACPLIGSTQDNSVKEDQKIHLFIGYDLGEAVFNKFQSLSGEIGVRFKNNHTLRLVHMNVKLTEQHLSSSFAGAVDGPNVEGKMFGFEAFYDIPILWKSLYVAPSVGYFENGYNHIILSEELKNNSATIGAAISYRETNVFGIKGLYTTLSLPMRITLNPLKETILGETTIVNNSFDNNIWFFIGFEF